MNAGKRSAVVASIALAGAVVLASTAQAGAASQRAKTKLTLASWSSGLVGTVDSGKTRCARARGVKVFKQRGAHRNPARDKVVGIATARKHNRAYQWSLKRGKQGSFYAKARKRDGCRSGFSKTYAMQPKGDVPACPSTEAVCRLDTVHFDTGVKYCPSFSKADAVCQGNSVSGPWPWNASGAEFSWDQDLTHSTHRKVDYRSFSGPLQIGGELWGEMPGPGSAAYTIWTAQAPPWMKDVTWRTPDVAGVNPGDQGGPLYLDFESGLSGADVYIRGYLYRG